MIPFYSDNFKTIKGISKEEANLRSSQNQKFTIKDGEKLLENLDLKGSKIIRLKWNNNGCETNTICAVSEKEGIIYDNFITNFFIVKDVDITCSQYAKINTAGNMIPRLKSASESASSGSLIWTLTAVADWIWGSERGRVTITHTGYYTSGHFRYHNYDADHYFNIGNSDAKVSQVGDQTIAYGYGFSTPSISINITLSGSSYSVSFSSSFGSTSGGSGQHSHPSNI